jgi:hypothetical protein
MTQGELEKMMSGALLDQAQIENKIRAAIRYDLATGLPLVP